MIEVDSLTKVYSGMRVLDIPQLQIPEGQSFGLVGNNGAGKTTFFRLILDLIRASTGHVISDQIPVAGSEHWKVYTGSYLDKGFLIDFLTPEEYFAFAGEIKGLSSGDIRDFMQKNTEFFAGEVLGKKKFIRDLSAGNQQKVGIAASMMGNPRVIILDEPFNSLDPTTQIRLKNMLNDLREHHKVTLLISSHDLNHITEVCDRICILDKGKVVQDLITNEQTLETLKEYFSA